MFDILSHDFAQGVDQMNKAWYAYLGWIVAAGLLGFAISFIFAGVLRLPRSLYLIPYIGFAGLFLSAFVRWDGLSIGELIRNHWVWGVVGAVLLAVFTINNILSQPVSPRAEGFT